MVKTSFFGENLSTLGETQARVLIIKFRRKICHWGGSKINENFSKGRSQNRKQWFSKDRSQNRKQWFSKGKSQNRKQWFSKGRFQNRNNVFRKVDLKIENNDFQ